MVSFRDPSRSRRLAAALLAIWILPCFSGCSSSDPRLIPPPPLHGGEGEESVPEAEEPEEGIFPAPEERDIELEAADPAPADFESLHLLTVRGDVPWTDTGLDVSEGQRFYVLASGAISLQKGNPTAICGPDGYALRTVQQPLPDLNIGALVGRIVLFLSSHADPQTGREVRDEIVTVFPVGSRAEVTIPSRGRFYLGINELVVGDNEGSYEVKLYLLR
ncbi:MAG: hypothetical protein JW747_09805 [Candidatus Aminicenantes bacterium]|nr:hypothetical protein [Candidatus Aminicenantes bacterium]